MASVKIVLRTKKNKDGSFPLAIRITTKDRRSTFIYLGQNIKDKVKEWDPIKQRVKKAHPNATRLNNFLTKKIGEINDKVLEVETFKNDITSRALKQSLKPTGSTFFAQATIYLDDLKKSGKYNRYSADNPRIERMREFLNGGDIAFQDITISFLNRFRIYLKSTREITERTIVNHLVAVRSVFSQAIKANVVDQKYYPFGKDKIRIKFPESLKIGLNPDEIKNLEDLVIENPCINHARNLWLVSFYFAGMRISDVLRLKWSDFQNDRLHYTMGKNDKGGSLKIHEKASKILDQYESQKKNSDDLVFHDLKLIENFKDTYVVQQKINNAVKKIDEYLKIIAKTMKLEKKLTMHIARHSFGNISGDKIPIQMLQKLYRHSSITTTIGYQANFIHKDADDALDAVVSF